MEEEHHYPEYKQDMDEAGRNVKRKKKPSNQSTIRTAAIIPVLPQALFRIPLLRRCPSVSVPIKGAYLY